MIHIEVPRIDYEKENGDGTGKSSQAARDIQIKRFTNYGSSDNVCGHFMAVQSPAHTGIEAESMQLYWPLIPGKHLPWYIRSHLIHGLKQPGGFLTDYGPPLRAWPVRSIIRTMIGAVLSGQR